MEHAATSSKKRARPFGCETDEEAEFHHGPFGRGPRAFAKVVERVTARLEERLAEDGDEAEAAALASAVDKAWRSMYKGSLPSQAAVLEERANLFSSRYNSQPPKVSVAPSVAHGAAPGNTVELQRRRAGTSSDGSRSQVPVMSSAFGAPPACLGPAPPPRKPQKRFVLKAAAAGGKNSGNGSRRAFSLKMRRTPPAAKQTQSPAGATSVVGDSNLPPREALSGSVDRTKGQGESAAPISAPVGVAQIAKGVPERGGLANERTDTSSGVAEPASIEGAESTSNAAGVGGELGTRVTGVGKGTATTRPPATASIQTEKDRSEGGAGGSVDTGEDGRRGERSSTTGDRGRAAAAEADQGEEMRQGKESESAVPDVVVTANFVGEMNKGKRRSRWRLAMHGAAVEGNGSVFVLDECECIFLRPT